MYLFKSLYARLIGGALVWIEESDGDLTLLVARKSPFGGWVVKLGSRNVKLQDDGSTNTWTAKRWTWHHKYGLEKDTQ